MQSGRQRLKAWIERGKMNQHQAAEILGVHDVVLSEWLNGVKTPGLPNAHRIEDLTGVPTQSWLLTDVSAEPEAVPANGRKRHSAKR